MTELDIDLNMKIGEWDVIQEAGSKLEPVYGPGYTGIENLGNSCYLNSVMQVLFTIPDFKHRYHRQKFTIHKYFMSEWGMDKFVFFLQMHAVKICEKSLVGYIPNFWHFMKPGAWNLNIWNKFLFRYYDAIQEIYENCTSNPADDFNVQM